MNASRQERFRDLRNLKTPQISMENPGILTDYLHVAQRDEFKFSASPQRQGRGCYFGLHYRLERSCWSD